MDILSLMARVAHTVLVGFGLIFTNTTALTHTALQFSTPPWRDTLATLQQNVRDKTLPSSLPHLTPLTASSTSSSEASTTAPQASSTPAKVPSQKTVPRPKPEAKPTLKPAQPSVPVVEAPPPQTEAPGELNASVRGALVNVLCMTGGGGPLKPISGSGVIIDPRGVVLTNAHVGQFFLLKDYPSQDNVQCLLRTGSPARATYTAALLYFPIGWLRANAEKIVQENPTGTGERDYSLLYITGTTNPNASLPASFPFIQPYAGDTADSGSDILLAGYPAGFLDGATIQTNLYISSAFGKIGQIYTFVEGGGEDLVSIPGTILSQKGASGGAAVRTSDDTLLGIITTSTAGNSTAERDLRAVTMHHINQSLTEDTGGNLSDLLSGDLGAKVAVFNITTVPTLSRMLTDVLNR